VYSLVRILERRKGDNVKFFYKMERKFGKYAIHNLMYYIIILYGVGIAISYINPYFYDLYLSLDASKILSGQVWRIFTFIIVPPSSGLIWNLVALYFYYMLGLNLERTWGAFRFNLYFLTGVIGHVLAALIIYLVSGQIWKMDTGYLNLSLFFGFALMYPDMEFLVFFFFPVKVKWLALIDGIFFMITILFGSWSSRCAAVLSLVNFLVFFFITRDFNRTNPKQIKRRTAYKTQVKVNNKSQRHKCSVCGRTEADGEDLVFRYCSKCAGSYEYCEEHLYTHKHVE